MLITTKLINCRSEWITPGPTTLDKIYYTWAKLKLTAFSF